MLRKTDLQYYSNEITCNVKYKMDKGNMEHLPLSDWDGIYILPQGL